MDLLVQKVDKYLEELDRTMSQVAELEDVDQKGFIDKSAEIAEQLLAVKKGAKAHDVAFGKTCSREYESIEAFEEAYNSNLASVEPKNIKQTSEYKEIMSNIQEYFTACKTSSGETATAIDGDVEMVEVLQTIDPITKKELTDPLKNKICGHIYEKSTITAAIQMNKFTRCPTMGCNNTKHLVLSDLVEDKALFLKLRAMRKAQAAENSDDEMDDTGTFTDSLI